MNLEAIIFDFDGVILESVNVKTEAFAKLYESYGPKVVKQVVDFHLKNGGMSRFLKFKYYQENLLKKMLTPTDEKELGEKFNNLVEKAVTNAPFVKGAESFLKENYQKWPFYIASGTPDREINRIVDARGLRKYFKEVYGSPRSKTEIIKSIIEKNQFNPKNVIMIGDALSDYEGAKNCGVEFIGRVTPNTIDFAEGTETIPDLIGFMTAIRSVLKVKLIIDAD